MKLKSLLTVAALTAIAAGMTLSTAHAQNVTVTSLGGTYTYTITETVSPLTAGVYTYNYLTKLTAVTPGAAVNVSTFNFNFTGPYVTATATGTGTPTPAFSPFAIDPTNGISMFYAPVTGLQNTTQAETFTFTSPNAPGGRLAITNTSNNGDSSAVTSLTSQLTGPMAAPEPSSLVALSVLGGCLALGITARRRVTGAV